MKTTLSLSISKPCAQAWNKFTPAEGGGHCGSCDKIVIDFTKMTSDEILQFFLSKPLHTCGRFRPEQLRAYADFVNPKLNVGMKLLKAGFVSLILILVSRPAPAQDLTKPLWELPQHSHDTISNKPKIPKQIIRGVVLDEVLHEPIPGAYVHLKGTSEGMNTDIDGRFEFPRMLKQGDVLVFSFIGYQPLEYSIEKKTSRSVDISLTMEMSIDILGDVAVMETYEEQPSFLRRMWTKVLDVL